MIEEQLRDGLHAAVTDEPPMGTDPWAMADRARRTVRRRRAVLASGAATVLLVGGAAFAASVAGGTQHVTPASEGSHPAEPEPLSDEVTTTAVVIAPGKTLVMPVPGKPVSTPPPNAPLRDPYGIGAEAARIGKYLVGQVPVVVPGASNVVADGFGQESGAEFTAAPGTFNGPIFYDDAAGRAVLVLQYSAAGAAEACAVSVPPDTCTTSALSDGSTLETIEHTDATTPTHRVLSVRHLRADGSSVQFSTYTYDGFGVTPSPTVRDAFPLTAAQLTVLATDVNVTF